MCIYERDIYTDTYDSLFKVVHKAFTGNSTMSSTFSYKQICNTHMNTVSVSHSEIKQTILSSKYRIYTKRPITFTYILLLHNYILLFITGLQLVPNNCT
jgi:hypothetical protein